MSLLRYLPQNIITLLDNYINNTIDSKVGEGSLKLEDGAPLSATAQTVVDIDNTNSALALATGQVYVTTGGIASVSSAILQVDSIQKGFLPPRLTTAEVNLIVSPVAGLQVYNLTTNENNVFNGTTWVGSSSVTTTGLLKTPLALSASLQVVEDYAGTDSPLYLSTTAIGLGTTSIWDNTNGRLGIGTTSPIYKLDINETVVRGGLRVKGLGGGGIIIGAITSTLGGLWSANITPSDTNYSFIGDGANSYFNGTTALNFMVADSQKAILNSTGLGIGTTTPNTYLTETVVLAIKGTPASQISLVGTRSSDNILGTIAFWNDGTRAGDFGFLRDTNDTSGAFRIRVSNTGTLSSAIFVNYLGKVGIGTTSPVAQLDVVAVSATVGLLVKGSDAATFYANIQNDSGTSRFNVGVTGTNVNTRDGSLVVGFTDNSTNSITGLRLLTLGTGSTYIDGYSDGTSKAANFDIIIGSRRNATNTSISGNTTAETGSNVQIGYETATIPSSVLTLNTVTRGFLPPRMTTTQKNAIASPAAGLVIFDTTLAKLCVFTTAWETITSV